MRIFAAAIIPLFFYCAAGVVITLLLSILLAYFLDPAVEFLERGHVPRTVAPVMVLILIAVLVAAGYGLWTRTEDFANWPRYRVLRQAAVAVEADSRHRSAGFSGNARAERLFSTGGTWTLESCVR
jgi:succinate dehydrogenase/fumarate reductase cytochrome b subunit